MWRKNVSVYTLAILDSHSAAVQQRYDVPRLFFHPSKKNEYTGSSGQLQSADNCFLM